MFPKRGYINIKKTDAATGRIIHIASYYCFGANIEITSGPKAITKIQPTATIIKIKLVIDFMEI